MGSFFDDQLKTFDGLAPNHTPFETCAVEPVVDHFVSSKEKPAKCQKLVLSSRKNLITCSECKYVAETTSRSVN